MSLFLSVYVCVFQSCLALCSPRFGEERAGLYDSRAFVCLSCMHYFLSFSLPLGVGGWLQILIVALLG